METTLAYLLMLNIVQIFCLAFHRNSLPLLCLSNLKHDLDTYK